MGAKSTTPVNQDNEKENILGSNHHPKLSNAKLVKTEKNSYLQVVNSISNKELFQKWQNNVKKYSNYKSIDSLYLPNAMEFKSEGLCGSSGIAKSEYQILPFILSEELQNRRQINQPFLQKELWYLLYSLSYTGYLLHADNNLIGDVRPENIFISEDGDIKAGTLYTFYDEDTNFIKALVMKQITLLAPEQVKDLQEGRDQPTSHVQTSQCFSIGMTILSALLLKDLSDLYTKDFTFNEEEFQKEIKSLRSSESYSLLLRKMIEGMCKKKPTERLICEEVISVLKPAEESILNLEDFSLTEISPSIKNKLELNSSVNRVVQPSLNTRSSVPQNQTPYNILQSPGYSRISEAQKNSVISPQNNSNFIRQSASFTQKQSYQPVNSSFRPSVEENQNSYIISHQFPPNSQFLPQSPQNQPRYHHENSQPKVQERTSFAEHHQEKPVYQAPSHYQPTSQVSYNFSKAKEPSSVVEYGSKVESYIPSYQMAESKPLMGNERLAQMGRQTTSIRPGPEYYYTNPATNTNRDTELFKSYEDVMKNVDQQLKKSRKMFPDNE